MASKPKTKSKSKKKPTKKAPKAALARKPAGIGHNGQVNKPLQKIFEDYNAMEADKKAIGKAQRDLRARAKEEHGVDKEVFSYEVRMQKKEASARTMFEQGCIDLKDALGYQHTLPLLLEEGEGEEDAGDDQQPGEDQEPGEAEEEAA